MVNCRLQPQFLEGEAGRVFSLYFEPSGEVVGAVVCIAPFGEEMNRMRSLIAAQARAFAESGVACLLFDLYGTGDSDGDLPDASWSVWRSDVGVAMRWLEERSGHSVALWGIRSGALLAAELANAEPGRVDRLLFWQPVVNGKSFVTQTLRQRVAALVDRNAPAETTAQMRETLAGGGNVEVSGYLIPGAVTEPMDACQLVAFQHWAGVSIDWVECVAEEGKSMPGGNRKAIDALVAAGAHVSSRCAVAPPVWSLHQKADAKALIAATESLLAEARS